MEKTVWGTQIIVFLGLLANTKTQTVSIPIQNRVKALAFLERILNKRKVTVRLVQQMTGLLSFICRGIPIGRPFTHHFHSKGVGLKQYHHLRVDSKIKLDCMVWKDYLQHDATICRPLIDFKANTWSAEEIQFFSDATKSKNCGCGGWFQNRLALYSLGRRFY